MIKYKIFNKKKNKNKCIEKLPNTPLTYNQHSVITPYTHKGYFYNTIILLNWHFNFESSICSNHRTLSYNL